MPLFVTVPPELLPLAQNLGFSLKNAPTPQNAPTPLPPTPQAVRRAWALGEREAVCLISHPDELWRLRPLALFAAAFGEPLRSGTFRGGLRASGGLVASEWHTPQNGAILLVHNPTTSPVTGGAFPAFEERTVAAGETVLWVHDLPLGRSETYLGAYAGLVKSELELLTAHLRPDPFPGARVFVTGKPGTCGEVTLFNAGPGESVTICCDADRPSVTSVGVSQVVFVPEALAARLWLLEDTTLLGARWSLTHSGELHEAFGAGRQTLLEGDSEPRAAQLLFDGPAPERVWVNQVPLNGTEVVLSPGPNTIAVQGEHGPAFVVPQGACYQVELTQWEPLDPLAPQSSQ